MKARAGGTQPPPAPSPHPWHAGAEENQGPPSSPPRPLGCAARMTPATPRHRSRSRPCPVRQRMLPGRPPPPTPLHLLPARFRASAGPDPDHEPGRRRRLCRRCRPARWCRAGMAAPPRQRRTHRAVPAHELRRIACMEWTSARMSGQPSGNITPLPFSKTAPWGCARRSQRRPDMREEVRLHYAAHAVGMPQA